MQSFASNNMKRRQMMQAEELRKKQELGAESEPGFDGGPKMGATGQESIGNVLGYAGNNYKQLGQLGTEIGNLSGSAYKTVGGWFK